jgi:hypothetical protein
MLGLLEEHRVHRLLGVRPFPFRIVDERRQVQQPGVVGMVLRGAGQYLPCLLEAAPVNQCVGLLQKRL